MDTLSKSANTAQGSEAKDAPNTTHGAIYGQHGLIKCECGKEWNFTSDLMKENSVMRNALFEESQRHFDQFTKLDALGNHPERLNEGALKKR